MATRGTKSASRKGGGSQKPGARSQEPGARSQEQEGLPLMVFAKPDNPQPKVVLLAPGSWLLAPGFWLLASGPLTFVLFVPFFGLPRLLFRSEQSQPVSIRVAEGGGP